MRRRIVGLAIGLALVALGLASLGCNERAEPEKVRASEAEAVPETAPAPETAPESGQAAAEVDPAVAAARAEAEQADTAEALAIFRVMSDFLGSQTAFRFEAEVGWDAMQVTGERLEFGGHRVMVVRRPDRARVDSVRRDGEVSTLYFDGQRVSIDLPEDQAYVSLEKPGTLDEVVDYLTDQMDAAIPLGDLARADVYGEVAPSVISGFWVEEATIDGTPCDHIALRAKAVDVQLWVEQRDRPVPRRIVITYREAPGAPQFRAQLTGWDFAPDVSDALFQYTPPEGAERIPMLVALEQREQEQEVKP